MFGGLVYLEKLGLNGNGIRDLPSDVFNSYFNNLISLRNLELHRNNIRRIYPGNFAYLPKLRRLILNKNKLTTLNQNIFVSSDDDQFDLRHLYLENNPIHCDQKLCWLKQKVLVIIKVDCASYPRQHWNQIDLHCSTNPSSESDYEADQSVDESGL